MTKFEARIKEIEERLTKQFNADPDNDCEFLLEAVEKMREALESVASKDYPEHVKVDYWMSKPQLAVAHVVAQDTAIARGALSDLEQLAGGE